MEEFEKTLEGYNYFHGLYLKAVNHPIRREILKIVNREKIISKDNLYKKLFDLNLIKDDSEFNYNINYLIKAICIEKIEKNENIFYEITQNGKIIEYL